MCLEWRVEGEIEDRDGRSASIDIWRGWEGVETVGGDGRKTRSVTKKKGKKIGIGASLTPDYRDKEESNSNSAKIRMHGNVSLQC